MVKLQRQNCDRGAWGGGGGGNWERKDSQNGYKNREQTYYHKLSFHHRLSQNLQTFTNFTQHFLKGHWSPSCLIHRQLHQRGHRESHGRREYWPPSLNNSTKKTAKNKDKSPRKSHIKKLNFLQFRSLAIPTF